MNIIYTAAYAIADTEGNIDMASTVHTGDSLAHVIELAAGYSLLLPRSFYKAFIYQGTMLIGKYRRDELQQMEKGQALPQAHPDLKLRAQR